MRSIRSLVLVVGFVAACGDNAVTTIDAAPDTGGLGTKCDDGIDNDGDGLIDFPQDPGCAVPNADDETDDCPNGTGCPQCGNGIDDDGNGTTDYPADPGCESAADTTEVVNDPVACGATLMIKSLPATGTDSGMLTTASTSQIASPCGGGGGAAAIAYRINLPQAAVIVASTAGSTFDTVLDLRKADCDDPASEIACHDDISPSLETSELTQTLAAGNYFLIVSGSDTSELGNYSLSVERFAGEGVACTATAQCGPGLVCRMPLGNPSMVCAKPQCADNLDDDADGKNGYPTDPGCGSLADNDETDPNPLPACSNGMDDDLDGMMDYPADTSCSSAGGNSEACNGEMDPITAIAMGTTMATLVGAHDDHESDCDANDGGEDVLYTLTVPAMRNLQIDTEGSSIDTVLSLMTATCSEPGIDCDDQGGTSTNSSRLTFNNFAAGTYIVAVDNFSGDDPPGPYNLHVSGMIAPGGSCEPALTLGGAFMCPPANPCEGTAGSMKCRPTACGDGIDNDIPTDGLVDFPADPGCASIDDEDESDTCPGVGPGCPECADGIDNDGDGAADALDSTCISPGTPSEGCAASEAGGVIPLVDSPVTGDTTGDTDDAQPPDACSPDNAAADHTYSVTLPAMRNVTFTVDSDFDSVVYVLGSSCGGAPLSCADDHFSIPEEATLQNSPAGNYFVVVDGNTTEEGTYNLSVSGAIQNGASCESPLAIAGVITCGTGFSCKGTLGSRTCRPAACNDGIDNDSPADGIADFPNDPGCTNTSDDDETDACPGSVDCPVCSDGIDNDADGTIDYPNDPQCPSASGVSESCTSSDGITPLVLAVTPGSNENAANDSSPSCSDSPNTAGDRLYSLSIPALTSLQIDGNTDFDGVLALYDSTCGGMDLACGDTPESVSLGALAAGTYFLVVDGWSSSFDEGTYALTIDGTIANGQSCEGTLAMTGALHCGLGSTCAGTAGSRTCQAQPCFDGVDNDSDGLTDYPNDPGCSSPSDTDEMNLVMAPVCTNTMNDDADADTDWPADFGCTSAAGSSEAFCAANMDPATLVTMPTTTGTTVGAMNDFNALSCALSAHSEGPDVALALQLPVALQSLTLDLADSDFDTQISVRDAQCGVELGCNEDDEASFSLTSFLQLHNVAPGGYAIIIDGYNGDSGMYSLDIEGVAVPGSACSSTLFTNDVLVCPTGTTCTGTPLRCQ